MARKVGHVVHDILQTIERVQTRTVGVTFDEFQADWELRFAVQRAIEIVSEASRRLPDELKRLRPEIDWRRVAGIGSVLRHEYQSISDKIIWDVIRQDFVPLKNAVEAIAKTIDE